MLPDFSDSAQYAGAVRAGGQAGEDVVYEERVRSYAPVGLLAALIAAAAVLAGVLGGGWVVVGVIAAGFVLAVGVATLLVRRDRRSGPITVTLAELVSGRQRLDRDLIARTMAEAPPGA